ncbi:mechanosensitive ion channel domain-containing protein [Actinomadura macrotermitis]|uniref:Mechanosensitive ion channel MscS domain-containing protein n=1 Tax=Actinomadura macrotermitis TaxID=2585200 RepID=A0A7K0BQT2_9ACTN|nr:hypothetical protein [Actinomadura macrotermitis]
MSVLCALAVCAVLVAHLGDPTSGHWHEKVLCWSGAVVFLVAALTATVRLGNEMRRITLPTLGDSHAALVRLTIVLTGGLLTVTMTFSLLRVPIGQLVLGGAVTGVLLGIAGQQTLANIFAGIMILYAHPFDIGDRVNVRSGPLGGELEGTVHGIGILYVEIDSADGRFSVPNSLIQKAAVARIEDASG